MVNLKILAGAFLGFMMSCFQGFRRSLALQLKELDAWKQVRQSYCCRVFRMDQQIVESREIRKPYLMGSMFLRMFSGEVSASEQMNLIKQLRERTSAPIKDVKSSLVACNWDIEAAQKDLRKRGVVLASKKSSRTAAEGLLAIAQTENKVAVIELNCETDFVARNEIFQYLASSLARLALSSKSPTQKIQTPLSFDPDYFENMEIVLDHPKFSGETTVQSAITEVAAMVGENVKLRRGFALSTSSHGVVSTYLHTCPKPGLGRIAGILTLEAKDSNASVDALHRVGSSLAMHIVAAKPLFLSKENVTSAALDSEHDILKTQAKSSGKSQMAIEKMVEGRLRKYFEEVVLLEQKFVMNDNVNIKSLLKDLSKEVGTDVEIGNFLRVEVGEGIQSLQLHQGSISPRSSGAVRKRRENLTVFMLAMLLRRPRFTYFVGKRFFSNNVFDHAVAELNKEMELIFGETLPSSVMDSTSRTQESQVTTSRLDESQQSLSHVDVCGRASMVDISSKVDSKRVAVAGCIVLLGKKAFDLVAANQIAKGDVLAVAKIAGISGAKQTSNLIPLCHNIGLTHVQLDLTLNDKDYSVDIEGEATTTGKTGVEMEAMTAVTVAGLTIYDMCKAISKDISITDIHLKHKSGGKSGHWSKNS